MYDAFNGFMQLPTWHTRHSYDLARFHRALDSVVRRPGFDADKLGDYMKARVKNPVLDMTIDSYVRDAAAVREFLEATGGIPN